MEIVITTATFALSVFNIVSGALGENVPLPESVTRLPYAFVLINCFTITICFAIFTSITYMLRQKKLI